MIFYNINVTVKRYFAPNLISTDWRTFNMVFNSIFFIFCFLPVFMLLYYLIPGKLRNLLLFFGSLIFYAWGEPVYVILLLFSGIFNYYMGTELERLYYDDRKQKINLVF